MLTGTTLFFGLVVAGFAAFMITLMGVHLYVNWPRGGARPVPSQSQPSPSRPHGD